MNPSELESVYNDLAQVPQQTAEQAIGQLGQQQAAQGPSAAAMGASGGYGIGDYTYNRLVDPTVQQLSTQLVSTGRSQALNRAISLALSQAQENYRNAYNSYANRASSSGSGGGGSGTGSGGGDGTITGVDETVSLDESVPAEGTRYLWGNTTTGAVQGKWVQQDNKRYYVDDDLWNRYQKDPAGTWAEVQKRGTEASEYAVRLSNPFVNPLKIIPKNRV